MLDMVTLVVEVSLAASAAAGAGALTLARGRTSAELSAPLAFDAGRPVSLLAVYADWNGEVDVLAELAEHTGIALSSRAALAKAVAALQAQPMTARRFLLGSAASALGAGALTGGAAAFAGGDGALAALDRLERAYDRGGWSALVAAVNAERGDQAFLPVASLLPGGLPPALRGRGSGSGSLPPSGAAPTAPPEAPGAQRPANPLDWLSALGFAREGALWATVESAWRGFSRKRSQEALKRSFEALGQAFHEEWRRKSPLALQVRRNVYVPLDAYRTLGLRARQRLRGGAAGAGTAPAIAAQLERLYLDALKQAERVVTDQCATLERIVSGRQGALAAGEALYRFRESLLAGVAAEALPLAPVREAMREWRTQEERDPERS